MISRVNVTELFEAHAQHGYLATIGVGPYQFQVPFGTVQTEGDRLASLAEKPTLDILVKIAESMFWIRLSWTLCRSKRISR